MIEFVKFFDTTTNEVVTYFTASKNAHETHQTFSFATPEEAVAASEDTVFIFWNNEPIGKGSVTNEATS